jgi:hypothetical protein
MLRKPGPGTARVGDSGTLICESWKPVQSLSLQVALLSVLKSNLVRPSNLLKIMLPLTVDDLIQSEKVLPHLLPEHLEPGYDQQELLVNEETRGMYK